MDKIIQEIIDKQNRTAISDFEGLSPAQMMPLLHNLFGDNSIVQITNNIPDDILDQIGFFRVCEEFLAIINREENIKLTPKGSLPKKIVKEIYDRRFILDRMIESGVSKNFVELELTFIHNANIICKELGLIKKQNNCLSLTAKGKKLMSSQNRNELFRLILEHFIKSFNWSYNDRYDDEINGQFGIGFTIYLLFKYGFEERAVQFFADKYLTAFPNIIDNFQEYPFMDKQTQFNSSYKVRAFERFLQWFNFIDITATESYRPPREMAVVATKMIKYVFQLVL